MLASEENVLSFWAKSSIVLGKKYYRFIKNGGMFY